MRLTKTIAFRLFLIIASAQTFVLGVLAVATVSVQQRHLMENVELSALRVSDVIARSARHSMLLNRKEEVQHIVSAVADEPGMEGIRIYNKNGDVVFASVLTDIHSKVDMDAEACVSCHAGRGLAQAQPPQGILSRILVKHNGERVLGLITPIRNEQQCANAACHAHPLTKTVLGVLDVKMSLAQIDQQMHEARMQLLLFSVIATLVVAAVSGLLIWWGIRRPVQRLVGGMEMVSSGNLSYRLDASSDDEFGLLARTFNTMSEELERARRELTAWSETLEQKVQEKTADLERAHRHLLRVEKMASLGNLASSVAHELNNPLEGILTFARLLIRRLQKSSLRQEDIRTYCNELQLVADEAQRCGTIVKNLLVFARQSTVALQTVALASIIDRCILLMAHHARMNGVSLVSNAIADDVIECDPNQIQQAVLALIGNAVEAVAANVRGGGKGTVEIAIEQPPERDMIALRVSDNGIGMTDDVKAHIFEPFFTTKSEGKGVGLGLSIVFGIIQRHHGRIEVESQPGRGATFIITLPRKQPVDVQRTRTTENSTTPLSL